MQVEEQTRLEDRSLLAILVLLVSILSVLPLARLLIEAFMPGGKFSLTALLNMLSNEATWRATGHSLEVSIAGTIFATLVGMVAAVVVALTDFRGRNPFVFCFVLPLMIAPQVMALAWLQVAGPASPLLHALGMAPPMGSPNPLYSREGIILLLGIQYAPLVFLTLRAGLRQLPRELIEAGRATGARRMTILRTIVLPLMTPPLAAGIALTFVSCIGNFGIPAFLGIPGRYIVLPTLIYQRLAGLGPSALADVSSLSILTGAIAIGGILVQGYMLRRRDYRLTGSSAIATPIELGRWRLPVEIAMWGLVLAVLIIPFIGLLMTSLIPVLGVPLGLHTASLKNYHYVLFEYGASHRAFRNSLFLAAAAAAIIVVICIPLGYFLAWRRSRILRLLDLATEIPYALPGIVLSIALILLFLKPVPILHWQLYSTIWILLFAYLARFMVLGLRPAISGYYQIDRALEEAAQATGARLIRRLITIMFPLIAPAAAAGALLIFLMAFNELTLSALLWSSGAETLGVVVFSFEQAGDVVYAASIAIITILVTLALMLSTLALGRNVPQGVLPWRD